VLVSIVESENNRNALCGPLIWAVSDRVGGKRLSEHREQFWANARLALSAGALSRHEEVLTWTADYINDEARRWLAWLWAFCTPLIAISARRCEASASPAARLTIA